LVCNLRGGADSAQSTYIRNLYPACRSEAKIPPLACWNEVEIPPEAERRQNSPIDKLLKRPAQENPKNPVNHV